MKRIEFTPKEKQDYAEHYLSGKSTTYLGSLKGCSDQVVAKMLASMGVILRDPRAKKRGDLPRQEIIDRYLDGESTSNLANVFKTSHVTIGKIIKNAKVSLRSQSECHRKYNLDEAAFDEPLSPEAKYWIGFLMADGTVSSSYKGKQRNCLRLRIQVRDKNHLLAFKSFLKSDHPLYEEKSKSKKTGKTYTNIGISVTSARICAALSRYGVAANKTYSAKVVSLERDVDFWRGVVDGDGCLHECTTEGMEGYQIIHLANCRSLCEQFSSFVQHHLGDYVPKVRKRKKTRGMAVTVNGKAAVWLSRLLYYDEAFALERKKRLARKWCRNFDDKILELKWSAYKQSVFKEEQGHLFGGRNHNARRVNTPNGEFATATDAAKSFGLSKQTILNRCNNQCLPDWSFVGAV